MMTSPRCTLASGCMAFGLALETSALFGLVSISELPVGHTGRGNERARDIPFWTYHAVMPASIVLPLPGGSGEAAEIFFVDSALPLRSDPAAWGPALDPHPADVNQDCAVDGLDLGALLAAWG